MTVTRIDYIKLFLKSVKYIGGAVGVSSTFMEGHPYFASTCLIIAGAASEALTFIIEKENK